MLLNFKVLCRQNAARYFLVTNEASRAVKLGTPLLTAAKVQPIRKDVFVGTQ